MSLPENQIKWYKVVFILGVVLVSLRIDTYYG